jgi:hypothetical protein
VFPGQAAGFDLGDQAVICGGEAAFVGFQFAQHAEQVVIGQGAQLQGL